MNPRRGIARPRTFSRSATGQDLAIAIVERIGFVPPALATAVTAALGSGDPARIEQARLFLNRLGEVDSRAVAQVTQVAAAPAAMPQMELGNSAVPTAGMSPAMSSPAAEAAPTHSTSALEQNGGPAGQPEVAKVPPGARSDRIDNKQTWGPQPLVGLGWLQQQQGRPREPQIVVEGSSIVNELVRLGGLDNTEISAFEAALQNRDADALLPTLEAIQERAGAATIAGNYRTGQRLREIRVLLAHYAGLLPPAAIDPTFDQLAAGTAGPLAPNLNDMVTNGHDYWVVTEICPAWRQCTAEEIADYLARYSVPGSDPSVPVENLEFYPVYEPRPWLPRFNPGDVQVFIGAEGLTVVNRAAKGHWFEGGQVVRTAVQDEDGSWYVITHGFGNNAKYDNVNEWQGPQTFKYMDRQIIAEMNRRLA